MEESKHDPIKIRQYTIDAKGQPKAATRLAREQLEVDATGEALDMTGGDVTKAKKVPYFEILQRLVAKFKK